MSLLLDMRLAAFATRDARTWARRYLSTLPSRQVVGFYASFPVQKCVFRNEVHANFRVCDLIVCN